MDEPALVPITDVLDLHTFLPKEVKSLLDEYFHACIQKGIFRVRLIHGKGTGAMREKVYSVLRKHPLVSGFSQAGMDHGGGGWGAVIVELNQT